MAVLAEFDFGSLGLKAQDFKPTRLPATHADVSNLGALTRDPAPYRSDFTRLVVLAS